MRKQKTLRQLEEERDEILDRLEKKREEFGKYEETALRQIAEKNAKITERFYENISVALRVQDDIGNAKALSFAALEEEILKASHKLGEKGSGATPHEG